MKETFFRLDLRPRSLRRRLMLWNIVTLAGILALSGGIIQYSVRTNLLASVDHDLAARSSEMGMQNPPPPGPPPGGRGPGDRPPGWMHHPMEPFPHMPPPHWPDWPPNMPPDRMARQTREILQREQDAYLPRLLTREGKSFFPVADQKPWEEAAFQAVLNGAPMRYSTVIFQDEPVRVLSKPIRRRGEIIAVLQMPYPLTEVERAITGMNRTLLMLIPVALLLAGAGGALLTDRLLRPVGRFAQTAEQIGAHDLARRLPAAGNDEFSHLAVTFNRMLARLETAFQQRETLVRQLENLVEQQRRFTADASHELKTPLTVIKANTSLLLRSKPSLEEYHESVQDVDRAADTMNRLVQDLLLLARYDAGQLGRHAVDLPLREILEQACRNVRKPETVPISLEIADDAPAVRSNKEEIARLFTNLLENAVRYTPNGEVHVCARREGETVCVQVMDTGIGIAPEHLPHLGERFYRVDASRTRPDGGGTGLGLSICKSIVEANRGTMQIESILGEGTTVRVLLPRTA